MLVCHLKLISTPDSVTSPSAISHVHSKTRGTGGRPDPMAFSDVVSRRRSQALLARPRRMWFCFSAHRKRGLTHSPCTSAKYLETVIHAFITSFSTVFSKKKKSPWQVSNSWTWNVWGAVEVWAWCKMSWNWNISFLISQGFVSPHQQCDKDHVGTRYDVYDNFDILRNSFATCAGDRYLSWNASNQPSPSPRSPALSTGGISASSERHRERDLTGRDREAAASRYVSFA